MRLTVFRLLASLFALAALAVVPLVLFPAAAVAGSAAPASAIGLAQQCPEGQVPLPGGSACTLAPPTATPAPPPVEITAPAAGAEAQCAGELVQGAGGLECVVTVSECPGGTVLQEASNQCVPAEPADSAAPSDPNAPADGEAAAPTDGQAGATDCSRRECSAAEKAAEEKAAADACAAAASDPEREPDPSCTPPPKCPTGFAENAAGSCYEVLDPRHSCVVAGRVPAGVTSNAELATFTYIPGTGECLKQATFRERVQNFEAVALDEKLALEALQEVTKEVIAIEESIEDLDLELVGVRQQLLAAEEEARFAEIRRDATEDELAAVRDALAVERDRLKAEAVEAYMTGNGADAVAGALLSSTSANKLEASLDYASAVIAKQMETIDRIASLEEETLILIEDLELAIVAAEDAVKDIEAVELDLKELQNNRRILLAQREAQVLEEAAQIAALREQKAGYASALGSASTESRELETIIAEAQLFEGRVSDAPGVLRSPLDPLIVGSRFGPRLHPILGYVRPHDGVDLSGAMGKLISSAGFGTVIIAGSQGGYGQTVVVDHGDGLSTLYAHMSAIAVTVGETVATGDILGAVGSTGLSTGPHLHWEVRIAGVPVDPLPYLTPVSDPADRVEPTPSPVAKERILGGIGADLADGASFDRRSDPADGFVLPPPTPVPLPPIAQPDPTPSATARPTVTPQPTATPRVTPTPRPTVAPRLTPTPRPIPPTTVASPRPSSIVLFGRSVPLPAQDSQSD